MTKGFTRFGSITIKGFKRASQLQDPLNEWIFDMAPPRKTSDVDRIKRKRRVIESNIVRNY
jgi:hypothetical protein